MDTPLDKIILLKSRTGWDLTQPCPEHWQGLSFDSIDEARGFFRGWTRCKHYIWTVDFERGVAIGLTDLEDA